MSRIGKKPVAVPSGVTATVDGRLVKVKGAKGELSFRVPDDVTVALENGAIAVDRRATSTQARPRDVGHVPLAGRKPGRGRHQGLREASSRSTASATRPPSPARC